MSRGISISSMCYIPKFLQKKYFPLPNLNFDDVVMSRGNLKFSLTPFCKRWDVTITVEKCTLQNYTYSNKQPKAIEM
jgi:hypothetical protein